MPDGSLLRDTEVKLLDMQRQARCLAEYFRRGDLEMAVWLLSELQDELREIGTQLDGRRE